MNFLEAKRLVDGFAGGPPLSLLLGMSGSAEPFDLYLRAAAAKHGRTADARLLPFNTLAQTLRRDPDPGVTEVFLLLPWDFAPEADWRSGVAATSDVGALRAAASAIESLLARRNARILYLPAPIPPLFANPDQGSGFALSLQSIAAGLGAKFVPAEAFSFPGYFASGCPVGGSWIGRVAESAIELALSARPEPKKVLVTDLDNVMWAGGIAEEGIDGIACGPEGKGFRHFVYQGFLEKLRNEGVLLAVVSRNDPEIAIGPFKAERTTIGESSFVGFVASYHAKSAQIRELASRLNLGLDSFVFVDDNPIELAEVTSAVPTVRCVQFPDRDDALPAFLDGLQQLFARTDVTAEDRERTEMYRRRAEGMVASNLQGADLTSFLRELGMSLTIHDRTTGDRVRAVQLINKTNQFNLNGRRVAEQDVAAVLENGGRLFGASLSDRAGSHGEILSCLVGADGVITSFVMSCRVFQRRVEHAFLAWLAAQPNPPVAMSWAPTERNEPFAQFLGELHGDAQQREGLVRLDAATLRGRFAVDLELFQLTA